MDEARRLDAADSEKIRVDDPEQISRWSNSLGVSQAELKRIVAEVGTDPTKVWAYLNTRA